LTKELKYLEMNKLLIKIEEKEGSNFAIYQLTDHGFSLEPLIGSIVAWGQKHRKVILSQKIDANPMQQTDIQ